MKSMILGLLAVSAGLLATPMMANAAAITWAFQSTVTAFTVDASDDLELQIGDSFGFRVTFSDAAPLLGCFDQQGGDPNPDRCDYVDATLIFSDFMINGALIGDPTFQPQPPGGSLCSRDQNGGIIVRNNGSDPQFGDTVDGISFGRGVCNGANIFESYQVVIRGPVLDIFNDLSIPTNPDPRLAGLRSAGITACVAPAVGQNPCTSFLTADIDSISRVPEPGTLALLGLGLAGLGFSRRRKA